MDTSIPNTDEIERVELLDDSLRNKLFAIKQQRTTTRRTSLKSSNIPPTLQPISLKDQLLLAVLPPSQPTSSTLLPPQQQQKTTSPPSATPLLPQTAHSTAQSTPQSSLQSSSGHIEKLKDDLSDSHMNNNSSSFAAFPRTQIIADFDPSYEQEYDPNIATLVIDDSTDDPCDSDVVIDDTMTNSSSRFFPSQRSLDREIIRKNTSIWAEDDLKGIEYELFENSQGHDDHANSAVTLSDDDIGSSIVSLDNISYTTTSTHNYFHHPTPNKTTTRNSIQTNDTHQRHRAQFDEEESDSSDGDGFISLKDQINFVSIEKDAKSGLINPSTMHKYLPTFLPPWIPQNPIDLYHYYHAPVFQRLHNEIVMFVEYMKPTAQEQHARSDLISRLGKITKKLFPSSHLDVFGSSSTQTQLPFGDVDLVLFIEPNGSERRQLEFRQKLIDEQTKEINLATARGQSGMRPRTQVPECDFSRNNFSILALYLQKKEFISDIELITRARVPVMKFIDTVTGLHVDITLNSHSGTEAAAFMQEQMAYFPQLQHLTLIIKYFLHIRGLNEAFTGGIGSFVIQTMIIAMLQRHPARFQIQKITITPSDPENPFTVEELQNEAAIYGKFSNKNDCSKSSSKKDKKISNAKGIKKTAQLPILNRITTSSRQFIIPHINTSSMNLGVLLFSFFRMYCFEINYPLVKIDISGQGLVARKSFRHGTNTGGVPFLMLLNPLDLTHDMTANSYNLHNVRAAFLHGYHVILNHLVCADPDNSASYILSIPSNILPSLYLDQQSTPSAIHTPSLQHISHPHHIMQLYRAELTINSTLLSELLPVCPELVDIRPNQVQLPPLYIQPRQIYQFEQYCLETYGKCAQEYLTSTNTEKSRDFGTIPSISEDQAVEFQREDLAQLQSLRFDSPQHISTDPVDVYLLMQKAFSTVVLQCNEEKFLRATDCNYGLSAPVDALDGADYDPNTGELITQTKKTKAQLQLERLLESSKKSASLIDDNSTQTQVNLQKKEKIAQINFDQSTNNNGLLILEQALLAHNDANSMNDEDIFDELDGIDISRLPLSEQDRHDKRAAKQASKQAIREERFQAKVLQKEKSLAKKVLKAEKKQAKLDQNLAPQELWASSDSDDDGVHSLIIVPLDSESIDTTVHRIPTPTTPKTSLTTPKILPKPQQTPKITATSTTTTVSKTPTPSILSSNTTPKASNSNHSGLVSPSLSASFTLNGRQFNTEALFTPNEIAPNALAYAMSLTSGGEKFFTRMPHNIPQHLRRGIAEFQKIDLVPLLPPAFQIIESSEWKSLHQLGGQLASIVSAIQQYYDARRDSLHDLLRLVVSNLNERTASKYNIEYTPLKRLTQGYPTLSELVTDFPFQTIDYSQIIRSKNQTKAALLHLNAIFIMPDKRVKFLRQLTSSIDKITGGSIFASPTFLTKKTIETIEIPFPAEEMTVIAETPIAQTEGGIIDSQNNIINSKLNSLHSATELIISKAESTPISPQTSDTIAFDLEQPITRLEDDPFSNAPITITKRKHVSDPSTCDYLTRGDQNLDDIIPLVDPCTKRQKMNTDSTPLCQDNTFNLQEHYTDTADTTDTNLQQFVTLGNQAEQNDTILPERTISLQPKTITSAQQELNSVQSTLEVPKVITYVNSFSNLQLEDSDSAKEGKPWQKHTK